MTMYLLRRLVEMVPTLLGVTLLTFSLMLMAPGDTVKMMLGPEATEDAITAKRVELGYQRYTGGTAVTAVVRGRDDAGPTLLVPTTGLEARELGTLAVHLGKSMHPLPARLMEQADGTRVLALTLPPGQELADGETVALVVGRTLVDTSVVRQYGNWLWKVLQGDLGESITTKRPVATEIARRLPASIELAFSAMFFALLTGLLVGVLSAVYPRTLLDNSVRLVTFIFLAMPSFWLGLQLIILLARNLELFPPAGRGQPWTPSMLSHLFLPALTLGVGTGAVLCRILRSSMLDVMEMDFVRTARAKGLPGPRVVFKHALKNALIPFVTVAGLSMGAMLGTAVIVETVFNWPGVGKLLIDSIRERDFPVTMGTVLVLAVGFVLINLLVDLIYTVLDPRIRLDGGKA
jgi:ABC-type dipeptide/oligopeptide/nickel transport system permease component